MITTEIIGDEIYIFFKGKFLYKRWYYNPAK